jgi:Cu/Ag efflux pump CusA
MILSIPQVKSTARRTGRAEQDEHALGVNASEIEVDFWTREEARYPHKHTTPGGRKPPPVKDILPREEVFSMIEEKLAAFPGVATGIGQPISHRIEHLLSGVRAQVAIKIFGDDLGTLRTLAEQTKAAMEGIPGVADLQVEQQVLIPQLHISVNRERGGPRRLHARDAHRCDGDGHQGQGRRPGARRPQGIRHYPDP